MKPKKLIYILMAAVIGVWGIIFYRVLAAGKEKTEVFPSSLALKKEVLENYVLLDTAVLALNYRDPFLDKTPIEEQSAVIPVNDAEIPVQMMTQPDPPAINWDVIQYTGCIVNPLTKKLVPIMSINSLEKMMAEGEVWEGVKLLQVFRDSVKVSYQGKTKYIHLK